MSNFCHIFIIIITILFIVFNVSYVACHTKGIRPKKNSDGMPFKVNLTQIEYSEQEFMKWVKFVGTLNHSVFSMAKNKLFPSFTKTVDKRKGAGDFTSIQAAIDSLPFINLLRVVIKVHAGVYT